MAGTIAFKNVNYKKAIGIWEHLQPLISKQDTALASDVAGNIAEAESLSKNKCLLLEDVWNKGLNHATPYEALMAYFNQDNLFTDQ